MSATPPDDSAPAFGPRPTMPPATNIPDDRTGASAPPPPSSPAPPAPMGPRRIGPPLAQRQRNRRWWWLVVAGALLLVSSGGGWGHGGMFGSSLDEHQTFQADSVDLTGGSGDVRVVGGAAPGTIEVTRHLHWGMMHGQPSPNEQVSDQMLSIDADCGGGFMAICSIGYDIKVPDAGQVTIHVGSGDIDLGGSLGAVTAETGSGNVDASNLSATDAVLQTGSGDVNLSFASTPAAVDLKTGSGDVTMFVPKGGTYAVAGTSGSGDRNVTVDTSQSSTNQVRIDTGSGDVELAYR